MLYTSVFSHLSIALAKRNAFFVFWCTVRTKKLLLLRGKLRCAAGSLQKRLKHDLIMKVDDATELFK